MTHTQRTIFVGGVLVASVCAVLWVILFAGEQSREPAGTSSQPVKIAITHSDSGTLLVLADAQGYFAEEGVLVELVRFPSATEGMKALIDGEVDMAIGPDHRLAKLIAQKQDIVILTGIAISDVMRFIAAPETDIISLRDLSRKYVGLREGSTAEYMLYRELAKYNLTLDDVLLQHVAPASGTQALASNEVDVLVTWYPYVYQVLEELPDARMLDTDAGMEMFFMLAANSDMVEDHSDSLHGVVRAMQHASSFVGESPDKAKEILATELELEQEYLDSVWTDYRRFDLFLTQGILLQMEDQLRWMAEDDSSIVSTGTPNILDYIYIDALEEAHPRGVGIIR